MAQIQLRDTLVKFVDGGTVSVDRKSIELTIGEGNVSWTEARALDYSGDRGKLKDRRLADEEAMSVSLDLTWEYLEGVNTVGEDPTPRDVIYFQNQASDWKSTDTDPCRPKCIDIILYYSPACTGLNVNEEITLPRYYSESLACDLSAGTLASSGTCLATKAETTRI